MTPPPSVPDLPAAHDHRLSARSDDELVDLARTGDAAAYGELFARHRGIGTAIARRYFDVADPDDIVAESFARILATIKRGGGPRAGFRPYLITTIGNVARRWATRSKESASDELDHLVDPGTVDDPVVASTDRDFALEAFKSLPERWQAVLWYSAVEGMGPTEISGYLGMTPNATAVLAHRARAGLRTAWVQAHLNDATLPAECRATAGRLGRRATGSLNRREQEEVKAHLATCLACRSRARELDQVSARLASWLVPALLGLGLPFADEGSAVAAAVTTPTAPLISAPGWVLAGLGLGTAASIVAVVLLTPAGAPPDLGHALTRTVESSERVEPAPDDSGATVTPASAEPSGSAPTTPGPDDPGPTPTTSPAPVPRPPIAPAAPAAPVLTTSIDPFATTPPSLTGSGAPGATVHIHDELGALIASVPVDAAGVWTTPPLTALSPAAAALSISQQTAAGTSRAVSIPLIMTPPSTGQYLQLPAWPFSGNYTPITIEVSGWPGATVEVAHVSVTYPGLGDQAPPSVTLDGSGRATIVIAEPAPFRHTFVLRYTDGVRTSAGSVTIDLDLPPYPD